MHRLLAALLMTTTLLAAASVRAAPDDLDPAFGSGGRLQLQDGYELGPVARLIPLPNDEVLASDGYSVWRVDRDGVRKDELSLDAVCKRAGAERLCWLAGIARQSDGKLIVGFGVQPLAAGPQSVGVGLARLEPDGRLDITFGSGGISSPLSTPPRFSIAGLAIQADGRVVVAGAADEGHRQSIALARFLADGAADLAFGNSGYLQTSVHVAIAVFAQTANGKLVFAGPPSTDFASPPDGNRMIVVRLLPSGDLDAGFAANGIYRDGRASALDVHALAEQSDGKLVLAGSLREQGAERLALARLDARGDLDSTFGADGTVVAIVEEGHDSAVNAVTVDANGRIVAAGRLTPKHSGGLFNHRIAVARFHPNGAPDTFFAGAGLTTIWSGGGSGHAVMTTSSNQILVGGDIVNSAQWQQPALFRLKGGEGSVMRAVREAIAVEYVHARLGNYFVTSASNEIRLLDLMPDVWRRTGLSFRVWAGDSPDLHPVCRFFSEQSFAPRFSHFFTPYVDECAMLLAEPTWTFEGEVFRLRLPEGAPGTRDCPAGSARLYRLYNNGSNGAPNHRYTIDPAVLDAMIASGWTMEGDARTRVFACTPPA